MRCLLQMCIEPVLGRRMGKQGAQVGLQDPMPAGEPLRVVSLGQQPPPLQKPAR